MSFNNDDLWRAFLLGVRISRSAGVEGPLLSTEIPLLEAVADGKETVNDSPADGNWDPETLKILTRLASGTVSNDAELARQILKGYPHSENA